MIDMSNLELKRGGPETFELLNEGKNIVHFLTNPFTPCVVRGPVEDEFEDNYIATNLGPLGRRFESYF